MTQGLYLEDLAVGQIYRAGPLTIEAEEMLRFARQYDPQYFHTDSEAAKSSMFGGLIASGWLTAALTMRLLIEGGAPFADGVIGPAANSPGHVRCAPATACASRARC